LGLERPPEACILAGSVLMKCNCGRDAFSLIEILIVVALMAILAATIIPQFADSTTDAKTSAMNSDLHSLHSNLQMYKARHGDYPATLKDLTVVSPAGYGPYIDAVPENPFNGSAAEAAVSSVPTGPNGSGQGWLYMKATGQVWANCVEGFK
jgi:prepilin-type N-terminal cleavage/methylation domain-containing protein